MAIFRLGIQSIGRSTSRTAIDVAAYRAGERLTDARNGAVRDYTDRRDVMHKEIVLPSRGPGAEAGWARDRQALWNAAEAAETRRNSRFAREYQVSLPSELTADQRTGLTLGFAREIADRYGIAVDVAIHAPTATGDPRHFHAHLLSTTREVTSEGFGRKVGLELPDYRRRERGLLSNSDEFKLLRANWAQHVNSALRDAGHEARVDHRSLAAQGIDREPMHLPWHVYKAAQQAHGPELAERARKLQQERASGAARPASPAATPAKAERRSLEDIRREAREKWAAMRSATLAAERAREPGAAVESEAAKEASHAYAQPSSTRKPDDDLGL